MKKLKYFIPSLIVMMIIFSFSSQTGNESSGLSSSIVLLIQNYFHISIPEIIIRKAAHMSEYALLTITFIYGFYHTVSLSKVISYSLFSCFLYACTDEFHQLFTSGRAGQLTDVLIDTMGGIIVCILFYILKKRYFDK